MLACPHQDCVHVFQAFLFLEASRKAFQSQRTFVKHTLPRLRRKAAERAAAAAATTSNAPSPAASPRGEFDFAEVDRDIAADAHEVDEQGNAEKKSLPSPPSVAGRSLPEEEGEDVEMGGGEDDEDVIDDDDELVATDPDQSTDSSDSDARRSTARSAASAGHSDALPTADTLVNVRAPTPEQDPPSSSFASTSTSPPPGHGHSPSIADAHPSVRPILRAYASARDLSMSTLRKTHSLSSPSSARRMSLAPPPSSSTSPSPSPAAAGPAASSRKRRSATLTTSTSSPRSAPSTPLALSPRPLDQRRELHARSSSHPDVAELLRSYMDEREAGEAPRAKTRVWAAAAPGGEVE